MKTITLLFIATSLIGFASCKKKPRRGNGGGGTTIVYGNGEFGQPPQRCPRDGGTDNANKLPKSRKLSNGRVFKQEWSEFIFNKLDEPAFDNLTMGKWTKNTAEKTGCKNLENLNHDDVKRFWVAVLAGLAIYESSYKTDKFYPDSQYGAGRDSFGLFQVDPVNCGRWSRKVGLDLSPSGSGLGRSDGPGSPQNPDPSRIGGSVYAVEVNIECTLATLAGSSAQYAAENGKDRLEVFRGDNSYQYWSPLKSKHKNHEKMLADMRYMTAQIPGCSEEGPYGKSSPYGEHTEKQENSKRMCDSVPNESRNNNDQKDIFNDAGGAYVESHWDSGDKGDSDYSRSLSK